MEIETDYIEDYFYQRLSKDERRTFEDRLKSDAAFTQEVKVHALLTNAFDELQAIELIQNFSKIETNLEVETSNSGFHPMLKWAAAFALFMMISTWFIWNNQQTNEELFLAYYTIYPNVEAPAVRSDANQQGAWRLFNNGEYEDAHQQFQHSISNGQNDVATWFYLGVCALELNRYNQAEEAFKNVITLPNGKYNKQAQWYLSLNFLKNSKRKEAKEALKKVIESNSSYSKKARELASKIQ